MKLEISELDTAIAAKFVQLVLKGIHQEYPHSNIFWFDSDEDIKPPREITPAFYGCLDWHSAVHGHWLLVRLTRYFPEAAFQRPVRQALSQNLTQNKIQGEIANLRRCAFFECPYGFAWLLQLAAELQEWNDIQAEEWLTVLEPLETLVATNFHLWLQRLELPDRTGGHFNTAFPLSLALDWTRLRKNQDFANLIENKARKFYLNDQNYPLHFEPLGYDFVSPCLAEANLMRRILSPTDFSNWLTDFLPQLFTEEAVHWLQPAQVANPNDYLQSHFRGLNLSRAWMLEGIVSRLPSNDSRLNTLQSIAAVHRQCGLVDVASEHYSSSHWLGTYAVYLVTGRDYIL
ncbi:DUF2891 domain-containing protein [Halotia wernerae UHCC 0503]|nr:DUF2891 domain-containing protein [Halotia wernerae UHCC 0503]